MNHYRQKQIVFLAIMATLCLCTAGLLWGQQKINHELQTAVATSAVSLTATAQTGTLLTEQYGQEAGAAIERFEMQWITWDTLGDWEAQAQLTTGWFLSTFGGERSALGESLPVTVAAEIIHLRVLEYTPERFKALGLVKLTNGDITADGKTVSPLRQEYVCRVYVFVWEDQVWKLAGLFNGTTSYRVTERTVRLDWRTTSPELRELIGEFPADLLESDFCIW